MSVSRDQLLVIGERLAVPHPGRQLLLRCSNLQLLTTKDGGNAQDCQEQS